MSKIGWLILLIVGVVAAVMVGYFVLMRPAGADVLGATLEPVAGGEAIQTASLVGKPTILILFTPT